MSPSGAGPSGAARPEPRGVRRGSASEGLSPIGQFPKSRHILDHKDFQAIQKSGARVQTEWFVLVVAPQRGDKVGPSRIGITASRKVGNAVRRNRVRRLVREWFRRASSLLPEHVDIVVICRSDLPFLGLEDVAGALAKALPRIKKLAASTVQVDPIPESS